MECQACAAMKHLAESQRCELVVLQLYYRSTHKGGMHSVSFVISTAKSRYTDGASATHE